MKKLKLKSKSKKDKNKKVSKVNNVKVKQEDVELAFVPELTKKSYSGFCMKCRESVKVNNPNLTRAKNGRLVLKGKHKECGTNMSVMIGERNV